MQIINVKVRSEKLFLQHINRCISIMDDIKLIHCYLADDMFKISYFGGIIAYDFSNCNDGNRVIAYTRIAMELIRNKLTNTIVLDSLL